MKQNNWHQVIMPVCEKVNMNVLLIVTPCHYTEKSYYRRSTLLTSLTFLQSKSKSIVIKETA